MGWVRPVAIGIGAAAVGTGIATQTFKFAQQHTAKVGEKYWDEAADGKRHGSSDEYGMSSLFVSLGALATAAGGIALLTRGSVTANLLGGAAIAGGAAALGYGAGGFGGFAAGEDASNEKHGVNIEAQADRLMKNFDRDKDGGLSTSDAGLPEYLYKYELDIGRTGFEPETKYASIEKFVQAADANGDATADRTEIVDKLSSFDGNGNGLLSGKDIGRLQDAGLESVAGQDYILDADPWGALIFTEW